MHQIQIGINITFMFHTFLLLKQGLSNCFSFRFLWFSLCGSAKSASQQVIYSFFLFLTITWSGLLAEIRWSFCISKFHSFMIFTYSICSYGQFSMPCTIPFGSPFPPNCAWSCTPFVLFCCILLLCDWVFHLCHHISQISNAFAHNQFSLW